MLIEKGFEMLSWNELSRKEQLAATHYDFYKDVHGVRPRWMNYDEMTEAQLEAELDQLSKEAEVQAKAEAIAHAKAAEDVEHVILNLQMSGAKSRAMAIKWLHEANNTDGDDDYLCYHLGLPYGYFKECA
jgi:hypothetical protein